MTKAAAAMLLAVLKAAVLGCMVLDEKWRTCPGLWQTGAQLLRRCSCSVASLQCPLITDNRPVSLGLWASGQLASNRSPECVRHTAQSCTSDSVHRFQVPQAAQAPQTTDLSHTSALRATHRCTWLCCKLCQPQKWSQGLAAAWAPHMDSPTPRMRPVGLSYQG